MLHLKALVPATLAVLLAALDTQPYVMGVGLVLAYLAARRMLKVRDFQTEISGLKSANATAQIIKQTDDERKTQLEDQLRGAQERANVAEKLVESLREELREWRGRYDEKAAGTSLAEVREVLMQIAENQDKRHEQLMDLMARLAGEKSVTDQ